MHLARVTGAVVSTQKSPSLNGKKLLLVRRVSADDDRPILPTSGDEVAVDSVGAGVGELVLLPRVRQAPLDTLIVADGFSCREQIAQATHRRALHLAEVLDMAATTGSDGPAGDYPERRYVVDHGREARRSSAVVALAAAGIGAGLLAWRRARNHGNGH